MTRTDRPSPNLVLVINKKIVDALACHLARLRVDWLGLRRSKNVHVAVNIGRTSPTNDRNCDMYLSFHASDNLYPHPTPTRTLRQPSRNSTRGAQKISVGPLESRTWVL